MPELARPADLAVEAMGVVKTYRLYPSITRMAMDRLGLYRILFWMRPEYREFSALSGIDLRIRKGERVALIGRNGAGKTTLLKLLTGNFAPSLGELKVNGSVQALMQTGLGFHPEFTGRENIRSGLEYNGLSGDELEAAMAEIVDFVELGDFIDQPFATYSSGMQSRLQFATATAIRPDILIIDEVLGAGDAYFTGKSAHVIRKLASSGCTLVLVSHAMDQVLQFCDRAVWLERGAIRADGRALEVVRAYEEFIARMTNEKGLGHGVEPTPSDYATPEWQREAIAGLLLGDEPAQQSVSRWPGEEGIRIARVAMADARGREQATFESGAEVRLRIGIVVERPGNYPVRFVVLFMTLSGVAVSRFLSPEFVVHADSACERDFGLLIAPLGFAPREFTFSVAAFRTYRPEMPTSAVRYDLLSRSFRFRVVGGTPNDPGVVVMNATWEALRP